VEQYRLRGVWPPALHAVSTRADREPLHRTARLRAHRCADESGAAARSGLRTLSAISRGTAGRRDGGARARGCHLHTTAVVASRRVARAVQRADQLLVARRAGDRGRRRLRIRHAHSRPAQPALAPTRHPRGLAGTVRSLRVRNPGRRDRAHPGAAAGRAGHVLCGGRGAGAGLSRGTSADMEVTRLTLAWLAGAMVLRGGESTAAAAPAGPLTPARPAPANVIPAPAQVAAGLGTFAVRARTRILIPLDPAAAASAQYFVDLVRSSHAGWLEVIASGVARVPQGAIAFRLEASLAGGGAEGYPIVGCA